jgi:hypothetical protein
LAAKRSILINAGAVMVFECIVNPVYRLGWVKGLVSSTFAEGTMEVSTGKTVSFREFYKRDGRYFAAGLELSVERDVNAAVLKRQNRFFREEYGYVMKHIGDSTLLEASLTVKGRGFKGIIIAFMQQLNAGKRLEEELENIKLIAEKKY